MTTANARTSAPIRAALPVTILWAVLLAAGGCADQQKRQDISYADSARDARWLEGAQRPPTPWTLLATAKLLVAQGKDREAQFILHRLIREQPAFLPAYVELAETHLRRQQTDRAMEVLQAALAHAPQDPVLLSNLGTCWLAKGDPAKALELFQSAAVHAPLDPRFRANMATALGLLGHYDEALAVYGEILPAADAHENLALLCQARNDHERAAMEYALAEAARKPQPPCPPAAQPCPPQPAPEEVTPTALQPE